MMQAMACMDMTKKGPTEKNVGTKLAGRKPYLGKRKPSELTKGFDGSLHPNLTCWYCKDT